MRKGGGKQKGSQFERDACRQLSLWVSHGKHEDVFWRSAMSGGRSTVAHAKGKRLAAQAGDISCIHPSGQYLASRFVFECKFYADLNYTGLLTRRGNLVEFWDTLKAEAVRYGKTPFLIARQNRQPTTICLSMESMLTLGIITANALMVAPYLDLYIFNADNFFSGIEPPAKRREVLNAG